MGAVGQEAGEWGVRLVLQEDHLMRRRDRRREGQGNSPGERCCDMGPGTELGRGEHAPWVVVSSVQEPEPEPAGHVKGPPWAGRRGQR